MDILAQQLRKLAEEGWDKAGSECYRKKLLSDMEQSYSQKQLPQQYFIQAHKIGSPLYTKMLQASQLSAKQKLQLVLDQLTTYVDQHHFLQVKPDAAYQLWENLAPMAKFNVLFRSYVLQYYRCSKPRTKLLAHNASDFERRLNLFRGYLDRQAISYLRRNYADKSNDFLRVLAYVASIKGLEIDYETGANYHNRQLKDQKDFVPQNMKIQLARSSSYHRFSRYNDARMVEFIVELETLNFVSQWDVIKQNADGRYVSDPADYTKNELRTIADTESFNYGIPHGKGRVPWRYHKSHSDLDGVNPLEADLRKYAKKYWQAKPDARKSKNGYGDIVNSGGIKDIVYWKSVPADKRYEMYQGYTAWLFKNKIPATGFAKYYEKVLEG